MNINCPINIILADDDPDDIFFFRKALEEIAFPSILTTAEDGEKLMDYLNNNSKLPDVIFLDINMPRKNGNVCLSEIKNEKKFKHIPVIIYSTSYIPEVANVLYAVGANYYLQKCNYTELPKRIEQVLTLIIDNPVQPPRDKFVINEIVSV